MIERFEAPHPSRTVQENIANFLSSCDNLIENNRRRMARLEEAARLIYRGWFVRLRFPGCEHIRITNGLPEGWEKKRVGDAAQINWETFFTSSNIPGTRRARPAALRPGSLQFPMRSGDMSAPIRRAEIPWH
jgi:type I restriction enzyme, S subunit